MSDSPSILQEFLKAPWQEKDAHPAYKESFLHMRPAPEYASGEVVLASLYRNVGFSKKITEGTVPSLGRAYIKSLDKGARPKNRDGIVDVDTWQEIMKGALRSPKQPNQTTKRILQLCPMVPDAAIYSQSARNSTNSWNPGELVKTVLSLGEKSTEKLDTIWRDIFRKLSIETTDDIWARFLSEEFSTWRADELADEWKEPSGLIRKPPVELWHQDSNGPSIPASQFAKDLAHVLTLKDFLTRRQWISILESLLRIGTATHVLWLCRANSICISIFESIVIEGKSPPSVEEIRQRLSADDPIWRYGQKSAPIIREFARDFAVARVAINLLLLHYEHATGECISSTSLGNVEEISQLCNRLFLGRELFPIDSYQFDLTRCLESDPRVVSCKKGITANISEFLRHVLGQRQTSEIGMDSYDQGYYLCKRGNYASAPWVFSIGPVAALLLVDCCTHTSRGPRTVDDFCDHFLSYAVDVSADDIMNYDLGRTLRNLNLVLDSPDAEGGMVLVSPFRRQREDSI